LEDDHCYLTYANNQKATQRDSSTGGGQFGYEGEDQFVQIKASIVKQSVEHSSQSSNRNRQ
jgi:hypothetical protein